MFDVFLGDDLLNGKCDFIRFDNITQEELTSLLSIAFKRKIEVLIRNVGETKEGD